jgi:TolB-like protein/class 3 adenylate cyclase/Flp pilus assembly protein TadD
MKDDASNTVPTETRRLAAIMFTDIVGFSRQMGSNEARTLRLLDIHNKTIQQAVVAYHGVVIKTVGDAFLVDFPSVVHAVQCAQHIEAQFRTHNAAKEPNEQIHVRIGIHLGDIVQRNGDVFGDGVNIASRLQGLAEPDTICISQAVYKEIEKKLPLDTVVSLGRPKLKNIAERFHVYAVLAEPPKGIHQTWQLQRLKLKHWRRSLQVITAVLLLGMVSAGAIVLKDRYFSSSPGLPFPDKPSIVVLPFANMSGDSEQEYFSDGITEDLTSDLSRISSLFVIARNSAFTYKGKAAKVQDISKELGVRYVLEGSVRKTGDQVRITAQLIDGPSGGHIWSERYDRPLKDIFALQDEIRQQIVVALRVKVQQAESERVRRVPTDNLTAYDYVLRGLEPFRHITKEENRQAREMFERAVALDPQYAVAYALIGWTYFTEWFMGWGQDPQILEQALALAQKARTLDDFLPQAHVLLSLVYTWQKQDEQALAEAERAIALDPNYSFAYIRLGSILYFTGQATEGVEVIEKAMRLNPYYPADDLLNLGLAYRLAGRYEEAIAALKKGLARNPDLGRYPHLLLAELYSQLGREEEARAEAAEHLRRNPGWSLEVYRQRSPLRDQATLDQMVENMRKAGLR